MNATPEMIHTTTPAAVPAATTNDDRPSLSELIRMLRTFVCQRPGFEPVNYNSAAAYRADVRTAGQHRTDALAMLRTFDNLAEYAGPCDSNAARDALLEELQGRGRLRLVRTDDGRWALSYTAGQYWCTEFRAAACRVLAGALWDLQRAECPHLNGDGLRRSFRNWYGPGIARRWFR